MQKLLNNIRVALHSEFDKNFERKTFFDTPWKPRKFDQKGSLMLVSGNLRRGLRSHCSGSSVVFSNDMPYATIHNDGGQITITTKMQRFFWAKYYETKTQYWKFLALKKVGSKIIMPKRQFVGNHQQISNIIEAQCDQFFTQWHPKR